MESVVLVSDIAFIKRGVAKASPDKVEVDPEQLKELVQGGTVETSDDSAEENEDEGMEEGEREEKSKKGLRGSATNSEAGDVADMDDEEEAMKEYLKEYEREEKEGPKKTNEIAGIAMYTNPLDDPYITKHEDSDEEEEKDDFIIRPDDNLVIAAKVDKGQYSLEVRVYNEAADDYYVHHDYLLEAPPLCIEPFHYDPGQEGKKGNLLAVGTMAGEVEIWDIDVVNAVSPAIIFGGGEEGKKKKKNKAKKERKAAQAVGHEDAVLSIRWNHEMPHILASGDASGVLILWDIDEAKAATVVTAREDGGLQSLHWHPVESSVLLCGSMGGVVTARDCREAEKIAAQWRLPEGAQVEKVLWNHFSPYYALVSSDDGRLRYLDMRAPGAFAVEAEAHEGGVEALAMSCAKTGLAATGGADGSVAIWSVSPTELEEVHRLPSSLGPLHSLAFSPNSPLILCAGGEQGELTRILDLAKYEQITSKFA